MRGYMEKNILNEDLIDQIGGYMRVGADFMLASAACGVLEKTAQEWLIKAEESKSKDFETNIYCKLYNSIRQSLAHAEVIALQRLSAEGGSTGAKWLLEKINPVKYKGIKKEKAEKKSAADLFLEKL